MPARFLAAVLVGTGCYAPLPPEGSPCTGDEDCAAPLTCHFGKCLAAAPDCIPIERSTGALTVPRLTSPITLDGDLADWPTCFITVDATTAGLVRDLESDGRFTPGRFSIAADDQRLYVAAEVTKLLPLGDHLPPRVFLNNAISVYFDADGQFATAVYDPDAAQIVVDHANRSQGFASGVGDIPISNLMSAASVGATTFTIEMAVVPASFGATSFAPTIGFDIGLVGGNGVTMSSELVWFQRCTAPACGCANGDSAPYCDARQFGTATFAP